MSNLMTQSEFAAHIGKDKGYVTRLKQAGRLVIEGEGRDARVKVAESIKKIEETKGGRDDVEARHDAAKGKKASKPDESRVSAQTRKEAAQADIAEMERDQLKGKLIDREQVEQALADVVSFARQGIENFPHRVAGQLVGKDFEQIMATLKQEVVALMGDMHREAGKALAELTKVDG